MFLSAGTPILLAGPRSFYPPTSGIDVSIPERCFGSGPDMASSGEGHGPPPILRSHYLGCPTRPPRLPRD
jgi:hypothetical protein